MSDPARACVLAPALVLALALAGCASGGARARSSGGAGSASAPAALLAQARPIGRGPAFHPPASGPVIGRCAPRLGRRFGVHVEVFARNRVVLLPAGIGTRPPRRLALGRITGARCFGSLVTVDPTGLVLVRPGAPLELGALFRSWGQPLDAGRIAEFRAAAGRGVAVFVNGRRWWGFAPTLRLRRHDEIVLEVGPHVPPHRGYSFPPGF